MVILPVRPFGVHSFVVSYINFVNWAAVSALGCPFILLRDFTPKSAVILNGALAIVLAKGNIIGNAWKVVAVSAPIVEEPVTSATLLPIDIPTSPRAPAGEEIISDTIWDFSGAILGVYVPPLVIQSCTSFALSRLSPSIRPSLDKPSANTPPNPPALLAPAPETIWAKASTLAIWPEAVQSVALFKNLPSNLSGVLCCFL